MNSEKTAPTAHASMRSQPALKPKFWPFALLFLLVTAFYGQSADFEFIYDDYILIVNAPAPGSAADYGVVFLERHWPNLPYYRPVSRLTMVVQKKLHGNQPAGYHLFNAILMGIASGLCYVLLASPSLGIPKPFAFFAALLFAVHPASSSTVYPICSGRETLIPSLFSLAAMIAWLRATPFHRGLAFFFFALALFSKEQAVIVPVLFVLADLLGLTAPFDGEKAAARGWFEILRRQWPAIAILAVYVAVRWLLFADTSEHELAFLKAPFGPVYSLLYAIQCVFTPFVELVYEPPLRVWLSSWRLAISLFAAFALVAFGIRAEPPARRRSLFWLAWILVTLLPTANLLKQEAEFDERYLLMSIVGFLGAIGTLAGTVWRHAIARQGILGLEMLAVLVYGAIGYQRGPYFRDDLAFHTQWVETNPNSAHTHGGLGWVWLERGDLDRAESHLQTALKIDPERPDLWNNLGNVAHRRGQPEEAESLYRHALSIRPGFPECHNNLATLLGELNRIEEAEMHFRKALDLRPRYSEAHNGLGIILVMRNEPQRALEHFQAAVKYHPENAQAHRNLARILSSLGQREESQKHLERAKALDPSL